MGNCNAPWLKQLKVNTDRVYAKPRFDPPQSLSKVKCCLECYDHEVYRMSEKGISMSDHLANMIKYADEELIGKVLTEFLGREPSREDLDNVGKKLHADFDGYILQYEGVALGVVQATDDYDGYQHKILLAFNPAVFLKLK